MRKKITMKNTTTTLEEPQQPDEKYPLITPCTTLNRCHLPSLEKNNPNRQSHIHLNKAPLDEKFKDFGKDPICKPSDR